MDEEGWLGDDQDGLESPEVLRDSAATGGIDFTGIISPEFATARLDMWLALQVPALSRSRIQSLIHEGHARVNGQLSKPGQKLRGGDRVELREPPPVATGLAPEAIPLDVIHEDEHLIIVNKAVGMVVHPAVGNETGTLVHALLHHCDRLSGIGGVERPGIVHRLDKETSGCMVVAKTDAAHQSLSRQFAERDILKIYLALAQGGFRRLSGTVDAPIGRHRIHRQKMAVVEEGRPAKTDWMVRTVYPWGVLVECRLHTGRTHQIRVHLKHLKHPILGDHVYGCRDDFPRVMLHAWRLGFKHPASGETMEFKAELPDDFVERGVVEPV
jgi:23S rRNA pseudouridine1911/1915/1917 synthase